MFWKLVGRATRVFTGPMSKEVSEPVVQKYPGIKLLVRASRHKNVAEFAKDVTEEVGVQLKDVQLLMLCRWLAGEMHDRGVRQILRQRDKALFVVHDFSWRWEVQSEIASMAWGRFGPKRKPWVLVDEDFIELPFGSIYSDFEELFVSGNDPIFRFEEEVLEPIHGRLYRLIPK